MRRCALYRHFDSHDILLYVGISDVPISRGRQHAASSAWAQFATRASVEWLPCRAAAEVAEAEVIADEMPVYNHVGTSGDPGERIAKYLAARAARGEGFRLIPERFMTLREAARQHVMPYDLATLRKCRRQRVRFPTHAGWERGRRVYSEESMREWAESLQFGVFGLWPVFSRSELRDVRRSDRQLRRKRTRGTRGEDNV